MSHRYLAAPLILLAAVLAACSGSSGSGEPATGENDQAMVEPIPQVPDPGVWGPYQDALGGEPLDLSASEINAAQVSRLRSADEYISTDYIKPEDGTRYELDCYAGTCTGSDGQVFTPTSAIAALSPDYEAIMARGAASIAYVEGGDERIGEDWLALSGWLDHTVFFALGIFDEASGHWNGAETYGVATGTAPLTGSATWGGVMIGVSTTGTSYGVIGNALLSADFASETLDVAFTDIHRSPGLLPTDGDLPVPLADMRFDDVPMSSDGWFEDEQDGEFVILGRWFGPNHAEVGGVFEHGGRDISGSFGAARQ